MTLVGLVELHVHTSPDVRARSCDDLELAREAQRVGARAVVIKSHHMLTADRAIVAGTVAPQVKVFGGVTLNPSVGGLNPAAVEVALKLAGKIVWLPTLFAVRHRRMEGKSGGVIVVDNGRVVPAAREIFQQVAAAHAILATGHQSADEIAIIVREAWEQGVRKILINHPEHAVVGMTIDQQRELRREFPVYFERCYAQPGSPKGVYNLNHEQNLRAIEALGIESTILASDAGQIENPPWAECWERTCEWFLAHGLRETQLREMMMKTPARLLGLDA
jgi:hypothetical protein